MVKVGDIIEVEVKKTEVYATWCSFEGETVLVLIPDTSWVASFNSCQQFAEPSDRLTVKIVNVDQSSGKIAASIRGAFPNPWESNEFRIGCQFMARVVRYVPVADRCGDQPGYLLELIPGSYVMLCAEGRTYTSNERIAVLITETNPARRAVKVSLDV